MVHDRLVNLAFMSIESDVMNDLDLSVTINDFFRAKIEKSYIVDCPDSGYNFICYFY